MPQHLSKLTKALYSNFSRDDKKKTIGVSSIMRLQPNKVNSSQDFITVVGSGPAGLMCAIKLAKKYPYKQITIVDYVRTSKPDIKEHLKNLKKHLPELPNEDQLVDTKEIIKKLKTTAYFNRFFDEQAFNLKFPSELPPTCTFSDILSCIKAQGSARKNYIAYNDVDIGIKIEDRSPNKTPVTNCASSIKHLEKKLKEEIGNNYPNIKLVSCDNRLTKEKIGKIRSGTIILANGANHELAKELGFEYKKREFKPNELRDPKLTQAMNASHINIELRVPDDVEFNSLIQSIRKYTSTSKDGRDFFYAYIRVHENSKNKGFRTLYINRPLIIKDNQTNLWQSLPLDLNNLENHAKDFLQNILGEEKFEKLNTNPEVIMNVTHFDISPDKIESVTNANITWNGKNIHLIGDAKVTPYYIRGEGIKKASMDIKKLTV